MRTVRITGKPTADGKHVHFLPFRVQFLNDDIDDSLIPTTGTVGEWATIGGEPGLSLGWLCVDKNEMAKCFGRIKAWKNRWKMNGSFPDYDTGVVSSFSFDLLGSDAWDVTNGAVFWNERFLPHGQVPHFGDGPIVAGAGITLPNATGNCFLGVLTQSDDGQLLQPGNESEGGIQIFETDTSSPFGPLVSLIYYSTVLDAFYLKPIVFCDITAFTSIGDPGTDNYHFGFASGPVPESDSEWTYTETNHKTTLEPFHDLKGYYYWPTGRDVTIDFLELSLKVIDEDGYFEFRDSSGNNPVWDKDTGAQLIIPVPMTQT